MKIAVIGTGYVGLVTGACFAETGNDVSCVDVEASKIEKLSRGEVPFYEPNLPELVERNKAEGRLAFTTDTAAALEGAAITFICVGTPSQADGAADLQYVMNASRDIAKLSKKPVILALKSTVPVGTADRVRQELEGLGRKDIDVASNPEFLREGSAVQDCLVPDRIVVGTPSEKVADVFRELYQPFVRTGHPIFVMDNRSAELSKYAANALLAMRISFVNEVSQLCEKVGGDVAQVRLAIGADQRIGMQYLFPSIGFGGSCFPKDVRALQALAQDSGMNPKLFQATLEVNEAQKQNFISRIFKHFGGEAKAKGKRIAVWGLSFKAKTDDIRESPALTVVDELLEAGMSVTVYDPVAMANVKGEYGEKLQYAKFAYAALDEADALCILTEWNQFRHPDFGQIKELLKTPVIFDGRNLYDPVAIKNLGFTYYSIGRAS